MSNFGTAQFTRWSSTYVVTSSPDVFGDDWANGSAEVNVFDGDRTFLRNYSNSFTLQVDARSVDVYLWIYFSPVIFILGLCGNILILAVMRRKRMRGTTTGVYLPVMAVFDTIAMIFGIAPEWFKAVEIVTFRELHPAICKLEKFIFYTTSDTAIWVLVLFTVDRFVAVCFPLHKNRICVPRRSKIACAVTFLCSVVKNIHVFWTRGAEYAEGETEIPLTNCGKPEPYTYFETVHRPWMAFTLISAIPFCILLVCNCIIIWTLAKSSFVHMRKDDAQLERTKTFKQTTMMCLSASFVFLICIIPSIVLLIGKPYWTSSKQPSYSYDVAKAVSNQLAYFNHSINFFLYCLTGQKFRTELVAMLASVRHSASYGDDSNNRTSHTVLTGHQSRCTTSFPTALRTTHHGHVVIDPLKGRVQASNV